MMDLKTLRKRHRAVKEGIRANLSKAFYYFGRGFYSDARLPIVLAGISLNQAAYLRNKIRRRREAK